MITPRPPSENDWTFISDSPTDRVTNNCNNCNAYCCFDDQNDDCDGDYVASSMKKYNVQEDEDNDVEDDCRLGNPPCSFCSKK